MDRAGIKSRASMILLINYFDIDGAAVKIYKPNGLSGTWIFAQSEIAIFIDPI
jgi:hypothetical protein